MPPSTAYRLIHDELIFDLQSTLKMKVTAQIKGLLRFPDTRADAIGA
jgi:hypothetical protein